MAKAELPVRIIPTRCEPENSPTFNRPSVEYTGRGNDLCYDGWGSRWFYDDHKKAMADYEAVANMNVKDGIPVNYNTIYSRLGIDTNDMGARDGWTDKEDWPKPSFVYSWCEAGTSLYDKFQKRVFLIEPAYEHFPYEGYWEL